jgi:hypothetical protein
MATSGDLKLAIDNDHAKSHFQRALAHEGISGECAYLIWPHRDYLFWPHSASGIGGVRVN